MEDQAKYIYKQVETENIVNVDIIKQKIELDKLDRMDDTDGKINPYHEIITNKVDKDDMIISQMEQWLIFSKIFDYVQYDRHPNNYYDLDIKAGDSKSHKIIYNKEEKRQMLEFDFGSTSEKLKGEYLEMYEGIQSEVISTTMFDENSDLSTTYLGSRTSKIKAEEKIPVSEQRYTIGKLLDGTECQILLDTIASKLFMSKSHYL